MPRKTGDFVRPAGAAGFRFNEAAARCRGKHGRRAAGRGSGERASMRPRPDAAENGRCATRSGRPARGFNEAAARCRGKREHAKDLAEGKVASMRPRPDAAENPAFAC